MPGKKSIEELQFFAIKCKLKPLLNTISGNKHLTALREVIVLANEIAKRCTQFFKAFCLWEQDVPPVNVATITACMQQLILRGVGGRKAKSSELAGRMATFWEERFSKVYPDKIKAVGLSRITQVVSESIVKDYLTNATTHFESRCKRLCTLLGLERQEAENSVRHAFHGQWDQVDERVRESLLCSIPKNTKKCVVRHEKETVRVR